MVPVLLPQDGLEYLCCGNAKAGPTGVLKHYLWPPCGVVPQTLGKTV